MLWGFHGCSGSVLCVSDWLVGNFRLWIVKDLLGHGQRGLFFVHDRLVLGCGKFGFENRGFLKVE